MNDAKINRRSALELFAASTGGFFLVACQEGAKPEPKSMEKKADKTSGEEKSAAKPASQPKDEAGAEAGAGAKAEATGEKVEVKLEVGDNIAYNTKKIEVAAGSLVALSIVHTGKMAASAMGHNFVLLKQGVDMAQFATAAISAADNAYIPKDMEDQVIANTKVVGGGEEDTIEFPAPPKGEYVFLCSFPGHYMQMNGKFIVG